MQGSPHLLPLFLRRRERDALEPRVVVVGGLGRGEEEGQALAAAASRHSRGNLGYSLGNSRVLSGTLWGTLGYSRVISGILGCSRVISALASAASRPFSSLASSAASSSRAYSGTPRAISGNLGSSRAASSKSLGSSRAISGHLARMLKRTPRAGRRPRDRLGHLCPPDLRGL